MRRMLGAAATAVALAVVLSGCSLWQGGEKVVNQVQQGIVANNELAALAAELRARGEVESAESSVVPITMSASVAVVLRSSASPAAIGEVATRVDEVLRGDDLQPFKREFTVRAEGAEIRQTDLDDAPVDYAAELGYWGAVRDVIDADLDLTLGVDRAGNFQRILSTHTDATVAAIADHYDAVLAIAPPEGAATNWRLPGILGYADWLGPLPERGVLGVLAAMAADTNLLDDSVQEVPPGVFAVLPGTGQSFPPRFTLVTNWPGEPVDEASAWAQTLALARVVFASGLSAFQLGVQGYGADVQDANLHVGECAELNPPTADDRKLVADLAVAGIRLPEDVAGICLAFATP